MDEAADALSANDGVLVEQTSEPITRRYERNAERWLEWVMALPFSTGPITDETGDACGMGQHGRVFFLAGTSGGSAERTCTIPADREIFFPLINYWAIPPASAVNTDEKMAAFLAFAHQYFPANREATCTLTLRLDGEDIGGSLEEMDENLWVDIYDPFAVTLNADNFYGAPAGPRPAALMAGHFALLNPLSPGQHTLELGGMQCDGEEIWFETSVVYHLDVESD